MLTNFLQHNIPSVRLLRFLCVIAPLLFQGCVSTQRIIPAPDTKQNFNQPFDKVWGAIVGELSAEYPFQVVDKQSGIIQTQLISIGSGFGSLRVLQRYAIEPRMFLATWSSASASLSVYVKAVNETNTMVRITGHFQGFENNVTHSLQPWQSNGTLENQVLASITKNL